MEKEIKVEQPTLIHFIERIVELARQGYVPSKTNQGAPQSWGLGLFTCGMVLEESSVEPAPVEAKQEAPEGTTEAPATTEYSGPKKTTTRRKTKSKTSE